MCWDVRWHQQLGLSIVLKNRTFSKGHNASSKTIYCSQFDHRWFWYFLVIAHNSGDYSSVAISVTSKMDYYLCYWKKYYWCIEFFIQYNLWSICVVIKLETKWYYIWPDVGLYVEQKEGISCLPNIGYFAFLNRPHQNIFFLFLFVSLGVAL